jgi:5-methylcytosine-specific restriction endonuclease McrA
VNPRPNGSARVGDPRVCELCGESYVPMRYGRPDQRWCSKSCAQAWRNGARPPYQRNVVVGMARKVQRSRIRSQRRAETWDGVTPAQIFERDRWHCGICGKRIGKSFKYPHPRSKSIDHIVPLSEGGDDTAANKRAAHLECNRRRMNRGGGEQLAMIG